MKTRRLIAIALCLLAVCTAAMAQTQTIRLLCAGGKCAELTFKVTGEGTVHVVWGEGVEGDYSHGLLAGKCYEDTVVITMPNTITGFDCEGFCISWLDVSGAPNLVSLNCARNEIFKLDVDALVELDELRCSDNYLGSLHTAHNTKLRYLDCHNNPIEQLDLSNNPLLEVLDCSSNIIQRLELGHNDALRGLWNMDSNISSLDLSLCRDLNSVVVSHGQLKSLKMGAANNLEHLWADHNDLQSLDLRGTDALVSADISHNRLQHLDIRNYSAKTKIDYLNCADNRLPFSSFYPYSKVTDYVGGIQQGVDCGYDSIVIKEYVDFTHIITNGGGGKIGVLTAYDAKTGTELDKGSSDADYQYMIGRVRFWHEIDSVYFVITNDKYADLEIRTNSFVVYDPELTGVHSATTQQGDGKPDDNTIYDLYGRKVVNPQRDRIYIRNGEKVRY